MYVHSRSNWNLELLVFVENGNLQDPEKARALPLCQSSFHTTTIKLRNLTCGRSSKVIPHQPKRGEGGGGGSWYPLCNWVFTAFQYLKKNFTCEVVFKIRLILWFWCYLRSVTSKMAPNILDFTQNYHLSKNGRN